ncbi:MAG: ATP-binding protein [Prevotella sp.]|uniref:AAA family ATPase n=1 Tax=Prevotella sp. TaxID=59823 RepID=UPI002A313559|nr:ATP-binding protein [Prevotella sp.]MDD7318571.1 ATP-binding protein [Prevotellaceae bacterium]MDY4020372.1 ATP-binding protein [Prevotella sp.]
MELANPFIIHGYHSPHYFCDREEETKLLTNAFTNGNNVALISPRRLGKTRLIYHCMQQENIKENYYTFLVDIYATKNLQEFVYELGRAVVDVLKSRGRKAWETFVACLTSLRGSLSFDMNGKPEWTMSLGEIATPTVTLDEIFRYLESADRHCIVAIDEFQAIAAYPEKNVEALLRTRIQHCRNCNFIFAGSERHVMTEMFLSASRPFYQSTKMITIGPIDFERYADFAQQLFAEYGKKIEREAVAEIYNRYDGVTWYVQSVLNSLFSTTPTGGRCDVADVERAVEQAVMQQSFAYSSLLYQLPAKQKEVLMAICREGKARNISSKPFLQRHHLTASSVQAAVKALIEKDFLTSDLGTYSVYDKFFADWLLKQ